MKHENINKSHKTARFNVSPQHIQYKNEAILNKLRQHGAVSDGVKGK